MVIKVKRNLEKTAAGLKVAEIELAGVRMDLWLTAVSLEFYYACYNSLPMKVVAVFVKVLYR